MKAFITGACGQVGSHVGEMMLARGDKIIGIDNFATGRPEHLLPQKGLELIEGTIADKALVERIIGDTEPDVIVHCAASYKDPNDWYNDTLTNCVGSANLIRAAQVHGVKRFIYFQTALCYGLKPKEQPITLKHPRDPANSSYAISKTTAEYYLEYSGLDFVTFRLANVIGPRNISGPLPIFFKRLSQGQRCFVTESRRDFCFVKDLAGTVLDAADGVGHGAYHFSSGKDVAIKELYDSVVRAMGFNDYPEPELRPLAPDDAPTILLDPSQMLEDFGAVEFTPLNEIVRAAVEYYREFGIEGGYTHLKHAEAK